MGSLAVAGPWNVHVPAPSGVQIADRGLTSSNHPPTIPSAAAPLVPASGVPVLSIPVGTSPSGIALNVSGTNLTVEDLYVTNTATNNVSVISSSTNQVVKTFSLGSWCGLRPAPTAIAFDPSDGYLYIADNNTTAGKFCIGVFSASTGAKIGTVSVAGDVSALAYNPTNKETYGCDASGVVDILRGITLVGTVTVGSVPDGLAFDAYNRYMYVANAGSNNVTLIDNSTVVGNLSGFSAPSGVGFDSATGDMYVSDSGSNNTTIISGKTLVGNVSVGNSPEGAAYDGIDAGAFVADEGSQEVTEIHGQSVTGVYRVGLRPWGVIYDALNEYVYVTNQGSNNVSAIYMPNPTVSAFSATPSIIDVGVSTQFSVSATGGTLPYHYTYGNLPSGCTPPNAPSFTCTPGTAGNYSVSVVVSDANGVTGSHTTTLVVYPLPSVSNFTLSPPAVTAGNATVITVNVSGGAPPLNYSYTGLPASCPSQNLSSWTCIPQLSGNYSILVTVKDAFGKTSQGSKLLRVNPAPSIISFTSSPSQFTLGNSTTLTVQVLGGTPPYSYVYAGLPPGCNSPNVGSFTCTPTNSGYYPLKVFVTDADHVTVNQSAGINVNPIPIIQNFVATPPTFTLGNATQLQVTAKGGTAPLSYSFSGLPRGCVSSNNSTLPCTPSQSGSYQVLVSATDMDGHIAQGSLTLTVNPVPSVAYFNITPAVSALGSIVYLNTSVAYGTAPFSYSYAGLPSGCNARNTPDITCTSNLPGTFNVSVTVVDADGAVASSPGQFTVLSPQGLTIIAFTANPTVIALGATTDLSVSVLGGSLPYTFSYTGVPPGCSSGNSSTLTCTPSSPGNYTLMATVVDSKGVSVNRTTSLEVTGTVSPLSVELTASSSNVPVGSHVTFAALVTGGEGPFVYRWSLNGTNGSVGDSLLRVSPQAPGTYAYRVWVTDAAGSVAGSNVVKLTVTGSTLNKGGNPNLWTESVDGIPLLLLLAVIAVALVLLFLFLLRRTSSRQTHEDLPMPVLETLPVAPPKGYYDDFKNPPTASETSEKSPFGTYEPPIVSLATGASEGKTGIYRPFRLTISPEGIQVNEVPQPAPGKQPEKAETPKPSPESKPSPSLTPSEPVAKIPTREDAYGVFVALARRPRPLSGILKEVPLPRPELAALLGTLVESGLVARTKTEKRGTLYALTPVGRKLGHEFIQAAQKKPASGKKSAPAAATSSKGAAKPEKAKESSPPAITTAPETKVVLERTIGEARTKEDPFEGRVRAEDINPNVQRIDPRLLQPMEMRVVADRVNETPAPAPPSTPEKKAEKKERKPRKKASRYGVEQAKKPPESQG